MKKTEIVVAVALVVALVFTGGVVEAKRGPSAVIVCVDAATGVVSRVAASATCVGERQKWSASKLAPQLCWDASSVNPKSQTRLVSIKPSAGCVAPLRSVPVGKVVLLCAERISGVLRWSVTRACKTGNANTWVRVGALRNAASATTTTTSVALVPSVSLQATVIQGNTWPKAVTVSANVAGTIYFVEGSVTVKSVSDITNSHPMLWAQGAVAAANTATSITFNVENLVNGYYRVYVVNAQGVLSAPATNIVTISVHPASQATSTTVAVRVQTLDQSYSMWDSSNSVVSSSQSMGQSFTAGLSGPLSRIAVGITSYGTVSQITAKIYATIAGNATGPALASTFIESTTVPTVPTVSGGALTVFDFASPASVVAGSQYVIVLTTPDAMSFDMDTFAQVGGYYLWYGGVGNFSGETGILNPITSPSSVNYGLMFQTYVNA